MGMMVMMIMMMGRMMMMEMGMGMEMVIVVMMVILMRMTISLLFHGSSAVMSTAVINPHQWELERVSLHMIRTPLHPYTVTLRISLTQLLFVFLLHCNSSHRSRLRDYLDPRRVFEDRKLNQVLKDLTDALQFGSTSSPKSTSSYLLAAEDAVVENQDLQSLNLDLVNAPGGCMLLYRA